MREFPKIPFQVIDETPSINFFASAAEAGMRLDALLAEKVSGWSRSRLHRLIKSGDCLVNNHQAKPAYRVRENDEIDVDLIEPPPAVFEPENIPLDVVFEDEYVAVINKPAGMVVHPGTGVSSGTLANAIAHHFGLRSAPGTSIDTVERIGIVHRLDKDTSGLIVVAKNDEVHEALSEQFHDRRVYKSYIALVHGSLRENSGTIDKSIARDRWHRTKMTVAANGRRALSLWKVHQRFEKFTLLDVEIKTGRTHQIRVHLASINHPIVGDALYNEGRDNTIADKAIRMSVENLGRFFLHAEKLGFTHPKSGKSLEFTSKLPKELAELLQLL